MSRSEWVKERGISTVSASLVHAQTAIELNEIHCTVLMLEFVSKRSVSIKTYIKGKKMH